MSWVIRKANRFPSGHPFQFFGGVPAFSSIGQMFAWVRRIMRARTRRIVRYPAVDLLLAPKQIPRLGEWLAHRPPRPRRLGGPGRAFLPSGRLDRSLTTGPWAYLKISDGCSNSCHYCLIPSIRGPHASRSRAAVLGEARALIAAGVRELNLVGQDITRFGEGRSGGGLAALVSAVAALPGDFRVRLLYLHPERVDDEVIELFAATPKLCAYHDVPIQHASTGACCAA